jgi:hypothetical protein
MLHHPTRDKLSTLRLSGMYKGLREQMALARYQRPELRGASRSAR